MNASSLRVSPWILLLVALLLPRLSARALDSIAFWDFDAVPATPDATNRPPATRGAGELRGVGGIAVSLAAGDPEGSAGRAWSTTVYPAQGRAPMTGGVRVTASTVGWTNLQIHFRHRASARAAAHGRVRVTADGVHFHDAGAFTVPASDRWHGVTVDLGILPEAADNASFAVEMVSDFAPATNRYAAVGPTSTYATSGTWRFDDIELWGDAMADPPASPRIVAPPTPGTVSDGAALHLGVGVSGAAPLSYQWERDGTELPGETGARFSRDPATVADAGHYRVRVWNDWGEVVSAEAVVEVIPPPPPYLSLDCAGLRSRQQLPDLEWPLLDALVRLEGVVTTHANLATAGDVQFFLQDDTGGLAVLWRGADAGALPPAGSRVEVIGPVRQSNGLLQMVPSAGEARHGVRLLESEVPLPEPVVLDWEWLGDPARLESLEGRLVRVPGVTLDTGIPLFPDRGTSLTLRSVLTGDSLTLRVDGSATAARVDLAGQPKPEGPFSVTGVWTQSDSSKPYTQGYQILPTRHADLVLDGRPPAVDWHGVLENPTRQGDSATNNFPDQVLRPGESFRILAVFSDDQGPIAPGEPLQVPEGMVVIWSEATVTEEGRHLRRAEAVFAASEAHAGGVHRIVLSAAGVAAERRISWTVSVPTVEERQILLTEFLANPTSKPDAATFNPLNRLDWPPASDAVLAGRLTSWDEFAELVNLGPAPVSLAGWTLSDSTRIRAWVDPVHPASVVSAGQALVLYGGPVDSHPPRLACPALPAVLPGGLAAGSDGLGLNNTSDRLELRNGAGHLIERVVYASRDLAAAASVARWPVPSGAWSVHPATADGATTSAGLDVHGLAWTSPRQPNTLRLQARRDGGMLRLEWSALAESSYTVWRSVDSGQAWAPLVEDLDHPFMDLHESDAPQWFRVTSP